jgi:hypothetical protein
MRRQGGGRGRRTIESLLLIFHSRSACSRADSKNMSLQAGALGRSIHQAARHQRALRPGISFNITTYLSRSSRPIVSIVPQFSSKSAAYWPY